MRCPKCNSINIRRERSPDGKVDCKDCGFVIKNRGEKLPNTPQDYEMPPVKEHFFIYHYSAKKQNGMQVQTIDGILKCKKEILDMEEYRDAKKLIFETDNITGIVITSLSKLN